MVSFSLLDELKLKVLHALRLNQAFKEDSRKELAMTDEYEGYKIKVKSCSSPSHQTP
jgi:hypothetical protein